MARKSARLIGQQIGKNAREVNKMLEQIGFLKEGKGVALPGSKTWDLTELGKKHGDVSGHQYSHGHVWDDDVADILKKAFKLD